MTIDRLLTLEQVSEITQIPLWTCRRWPSRGGGPVCRKLGGSVRIRESDPMAWIDSCATPASTRDDRGASSE